jgi:hypothetical protein
LSLKTPSTTGYQIADGAVFTLGAVRARGDAERQSFRNPYGIGRITVDAAEMKQTPQE